MANLLPVRYTIPVLKHDTPIRVTVSYAQSVDGRIATCTGDSRWISCPESLDFAHTLRGSHDAIMVGIGTVLADNPRLTCRLEECQSPHRVILDSTLRLPLTANITQSADRVATTVLCTEKAISEKPERVRELSDFGVRVVPVDECEYGLDLRSVFQELNTMHVSTLFVEGGSTLVTTMLRERCVDRLIVVLAPVIIGTGYNAIGDLNVQALSEAQRARPVSLSHFGKDIAWELSFDRGAVS